MCVGGSLGSPSRRKGIVDAEKWYVSPGYLDLLAIDNKELAIIRGK